MDHRHHEHISSAATPPAPGGVTVYTCPMHPEVRQDHPGSCPKCGMNLVPVQGGKARRPPPSIMIIKATATATCPPMAGRSKRRRPVMPITHWSGHCPDPQPQPREASAPPRLHRRARSTPARCTRRSGRITPAVAPRGDDPLEPLIPEATADDDNPGIAGLHAPFLVDLALTVVVTTLAMVGHRFGIMTPLSRAGWSSCCRCRSSHGPVGPSSLDAGNR